MSYQNILLEEVESGIQIITVNRPEVLNALNRQTLEELCDAVARVDAMDDARVLLLTGAGEKAFIAGADISAMQDMSAVEAKDFAQLARTLSMRLEGLRVPSMAVVGGYCLGGGCELAMSCDWILAGEKALFGQPEVSLGVIPGMGGTQRLTRLVGPARAKELVISGRQVKAEEAVAMAWPTMSIRQMS